MKRVVSVSIGSPTRDKSVIAEILGEKFIIERIGTNGDIKKAIEMIKELDGKVDAFGMGGIDLHLAGGANKRYVIREAIPIMKAAKKTPIVDGSGIKNTLEARVIEYLRDNKIIEFKGKKVLVSSAADRYNMTKAIIDSGADVIIGDIIFALGLPIPLKKLETFKRVADILMPIFSKLPFKLLYPVGNKQNESNSNKFSKYYLDADIIAGDFHFLKKYMPPRMKNKIIITNTVTSEDVEMLKAKGIHMLVTTTPEFDGRSFGTNVIEAILVAVSGKHPSEITEADYHNLLDKLDFKPRIEILNEYMPKSE